MLCGTEEVIAHRGQVRAAINNFSRWSELTITNDSTHFDSTDQHTGSISNKRRNSGAKIVKSIRGGKKHKKSPSPTTAIVVNSHTSAVSTSKVKRRHQSEKGKVVKTHIDDTASKSLKIISTVLANSNSNRNSEPSANKAIVNNNSQSIKRFLIRNNELPSNQYSPNVTARSNNNTESHVNDKTNTSPAAVSPITSLKTNTIAYINHNSCSVSTTSGLEMAENNAQQKSAADAAQLLELQKQHDAAIAKLEEAISKTEENSLQRTLLEIKLEMKIDNFETRKSLSTVISNTSVLQQELSNLKDQHSTMSSHIDRVVEQQNAEKLKTSTDIEKVDRKVNLLIDIMSNQANALKETKKQVINTESKNLSAGLFIAGIEEESEEADHSTAELVTDFFKNIMKIEQTISLKSAHRVGKGDQCSIYVRVSKTLKISLTMLMTTYLPLNRRSSKSLKILFAKTINFPCPTKSTWACEKASCSLRITNSNQQ